MLDKFRRVPRAEFDAWEREYFAQQGPRTYGHAFVERFFLGGFMPAIEDVSAQEARRFILEHLIA